MQVPPPPERSKRERWLRALRKVLEVIVASLVIAALLNIAASRSARLGRVAGLPEGVRDGALMPAAMPALLAGKDVTIYAPNNSGRMYKLGYTMGVNGCGLLFFGFFFWRLRRIV